MKGVLLYSDKLIKKIGTWSIKFIFIIINVKKESKLLSVIKNDIE